MYLKLKGDKIKRRKFWIRQPILKRQIKREFWKLIGITWSREIRRRNCTNEKVEKAWAIHLMRAFRLYLQWLVATTDQVLSVKVCYFQHAHTRIPSFCCDNCCTITCLDFTFSNYLKFPRKSFCSMSPKFNCQVFKIPADIYLFKINGKTRAMCEICSKLTIKIAQRLYWDRSGVFIFNLEEILHIVDFEPAGSWSKTNYSIS